MVSELYTIFFVSTKWILWNVQYQWRQEKVTQKVESWEKVYLMDKRIGLSVSPITHAKGACGQGFVQTIQFFLHQTCLSFLWTVFCALLNHLVGTWTGFFQSVSSLSLQSLSALLWCPSACFTPVHKTIWIYTLRCEAAWPWNSIPWSPVNISLRLSMPFFAYGFLHVLNTCSFYNRT